MKTILSLALLLISIEAFALNLKLQMPSVIYGNDDRTNVSDSKTPQYAAWADSVVALIAKENFEDHINGNFIPVASNAGEDYDMCSEERFLDEPDIADCSGFLVAPDVVATAAHCVETTCADRFIVFGYSSADPNQKFPDGEVYACTGILALQHSEAGGDFALIKLDRQVVNHKVLSLTSRSAQTGEQLVLIGHPLGMPTKIADNAIVRSVSDVSFNANLDSFTGNSGSPVISTKTGEVLGLLADGVKDFQDDFQNQCVRSYVCTDDGCAGETVTQASIVQNALLGL